MKAKLPISLLIFQAAAFAVAAKSQESGSIISQIAGGFGAIIAGSLGLKIAVAVIAVIGVAIGFWKGSAGIW